MKLSSEVLKSGKDVVDVSTMSDEELSTYRNSFDPDSMGFDGVEGTDEEGEDEDK